ncbi:MFS transporter [Kyrpidia tusciae]|uniref:Major facilitator superfamily MFS_1 n=1 Tax=Kyrpidia tusciae (strain DSM 2912 / NBRC 15312 / T2) TaxID=562970 RepID=D5WWD2_KYRT2|nr:MFS transporter [Kyrpidia tusciae]ADG07697.1 major facilitator superfamily MFS_1 [Kyrpidia tusciae DSM 2912]
MSSTERRLDPRGRQAIIGAFLGFFVDMFDVWLPVIVLGPAISYFVPNTLGASTLSVVNSVVFVVTLVARPIGALLFGHVADRFGRKRTAIISVTGFGITTLLMACLPGYQTWGLASLVLLIILRFIDGLFLAGEYTSASPLAMEYCPREKRGFYGALIMSGFPLSYIVINFLTFLMLQVAPLNGPDAPYIHWGWRIPFFVGAAISLLFVLYYKKFVPESELWERSERSINPLRTLFSAGNLKGFFQVWVMMNGFWLTSYMISAVIPGLLNKSLHLPQTTVTIVMLTSEVALFVAYLAAGMISQRIGRRTYLIWAGLVAAVVGGMLNYWLISTEWQGVWGIFILTILIEVIVGNIWGLATTYINERFRTNVRASGFGLGYSLAVVLPSFYAFYQIWLSRIVPAVYTELVLLIIGSILVVIGAALGPETKDVDFAQD